MKKPVLAITMGDVNGVGPEVLWKGLSCGAIGRWCHPLILGSADILQWAQQFAQGGPELEAIEDLRDWNWETGRIPVLDGGFRAPSPRPGVLDPEASLCAAEWIKTAIRLCQEGAVAGMVTCPITKEGLRQAGYSYTGHTTLIAEMTGAKDYRMCLFTDRLRIVHITAHLSLREAIESVKMARILRSIRIADEALRHMGMAHPRIAVAGLNPHAGEAGAFGREEIEEIQPAVERARTEGLDCSGPHPPDTVFRRMNEGEFDVVIAMYHDQGHIPLKLIAMDEGVNVTLGIPIVRTSVDHGTAFDIAGQGVAREHSLCAAVRFAAQLAGYRESSP